MTLFYDAANPDNIPAGARACVYADGEFKATPVQVKRLGPTRYITVEGGAQAAKGAGCADAESGNPVYDPALLREWAVERGAMGCRARVYSNRSDFKRVWDATHDLKNACYWVATGELDNGKQWTAAALAANLAQWGVPGLNPARLWAVQFTLNPHGGVDEDWLLGVW